MNLEDLPKDVQFLFIGIANAAIAAYDRELSKDQFTSFCSEVWDSMLMNGVDEFHRIVDGYMTKDMDSRLGAGMTSLIKSIGKKR